MKSSTECISCTMKKKKQVFSRVLRSCGLPQELDTRQFFVQWIGGAECVIEQHRGILCFETQRIRFATEQGTIEITGDPLEMERLSESRALVRGKIRSVALEAKS